MVKEKREQRILLLSFLSGLLFAVVELIYAIFSHSQSVLMDAVYDSTELIFIALILFLTPLFYQPVSEKHPYGYFQIESIFLIIKSVMMLSVTLGVSTQVVQSALDGGNRVNELNISIFQLVLGLISVVIYFVMRKMNHALASPTIDAEILGWKTDVAYSLGMSAAFFASLFLQGTPLDWMIPYFDQLMAVLVMLLTLPEMIQILWDAMKSLFMFSPDADTVDRIKALCTEMLEENGFHPVFFEVTRTGRHMWVEIYFKIEEEALLVRDLKQMTVRINQSVGNVFENCTCELMLEP